jgi:hypothetical protein
VSRQSEEEVYRQNPSFSRQIDAALSKSQGGRALDLPAAPPDPAKPDLPPAHREVKMNQAERRYSVHLAKLQAAYEINYFRFEAIKLRLARLTFYTPDFLVVTNSGSIELHEVKAIWKPQSRAHWEDDARVKIKVAVELYPCFLFRAAWLDNGEWKFERF